MQRLKTLDNDDRYELNPEYVYLKKIAMTTNEASRMIKKSFWVLIQKIGFFISLFGEISEILRLLRICICHPQLYTSIT
jgi:hypothetical protein